MSQVIVTNDKLSERRRNSRDQELRINKEDRFAVWRRSDVTKPDAFQRALGFAVLPILGLWAGLCALIAAVAFLVRSIFKILGSLLGGARSLITS